MYQTKRDFQVTHTDNVGKIHTFHCSMGVNYLLTDEYKTDPSLQGKYKTSFGAKNNTSITLFSEKKLDFDMLSEVLILEEISNDEQADAAIVLVQRKLQTLLSPIVLRLSNKEKIQIPLPIKTLKGQRSYTDIYDISSNYLKANDLHFAIVGGYTSGRLQEVGKSIYFLFKYHNVLQAPLKQIVKLVKSDEFQQQLANQLYQGIV